MRIIKLAALYVAVSGAFALCANAPAFARGGAANLMNSPGYQRALQESRQRYLRAYSQPVVVAPRRTWRHRHVRRHRSY